MAAYGGAESIVAPNPESKTIYDVLRMIVNGITWKSESDFRDVMQAINTAEQNKLFGIEGRMSL